MCFDSIGVSALWQLNAAVEAAARLAYDVLLFFVFFFFVPLGLDDQVAVFDRNIDVVFIEFNGYA